MKVNEKLVRKALQGDETAFAELYTAKIRTILYQAYRITGNMDDAEDIAQNVGIRIYKNIGKLKDPQFFNSWVYSIVVNESNRMLKKEMKRKNADLPLESEEVVLLEDKAELLPHSFLENEEKRMALVEAIEQLPQNRRELILMYYYEDMSTAEISKLMGMSESAVRTTISRTRQELKEKMGKRFGTWEAAAGVGMGASVIENALKIHVRSLFSDTVAQSVAQKGVEAALCGAKPLVAHAAGAKVATKIVSTVVSLALMLSTTVLLIRNIPSRSSYEPYSTFSAAPEEDMPPQSIFADGAAEEGVYVSAVNGRINLVDRTGKVVADSGVSNEGMEVWLEDGRKNVLATTTVNHSFAFEFPAMIFEDGKEYFLKIKENGAEFSIYSLEQGGQRLEDVVLNVVFTSSPQGRIVANGLDPGQAGQTPANTARIEFVSDYVKLESTRWHITGPGDETVLLAGEGAILPQDIAALKAAGQLKEYTAVFVVVDVFGNEAEYRADFLLAT